jgi:hypothetical protein
MGTLKILLRSDVNTEIKIGTNKGNCFYFRLLFFVYKNFNRYFIEINRYIRNSPRIERDGAIFKLFFISVVCFVFSKSFCCLLGLSGGVRLRRVRLCEHCRIFCSLSVVSFTFGCSMVNLKTECKTTR